MASPSQSPSTLSPPPSTTTTTTTTTVTTTTSPPSQPPSTTVTPTPPPPRKFPAPCWTQEETLALIGAYQDKWYSLRRRNLRTADWEAVAADVTRRCPDVTPTKTSAQCRHKMEKLRKRYRTEKQRALSLPHNLQSRFFSPSSWVFFDLMEAMEAGSNPSENPQIKISNINHHHHHQNHQLNQFGSGLKAADLVERERERSLNNMMNMKGGNHHNSKEDFAKYFDEILMGTGGGNNNNTGGGGGSVPIKIKVKNNNHQQQQQQNQHLQNLHRFDNLSKREEDEDEDEDDEYYDGNSRHNSMSGGPPKRKFSEDRFDSMTSMGARKMMSLNGCSNSKGGGGSGSGSRSRDAVGEMVASIKMLGEGLVRMEKMKMDMMREIEKMRMDMEMKRSEMILESQQLIVNAFVEGLKNKNTSSKKIKVMEVE